MINRIFGKDNDSAIQSLRFDLAIMRESNGEREVWVGQCLQYDIAAQADSIPHLLKRFRRILIGTMILALKNNERPFANLKPAPDRYWTNFQNGVPLAIQFAVAVPGDKIPKGIDLPPSRIPRGEGVLKLTEDVEEVA
jgi:hypothetical protein